MIPRTIRISRRTEIGWRFIASFAIFLQLFWEWRFGVVSPDQTEDCMES